MQTNVSLFFVFNLLYANIFHMRKIEETPVKIENKMNLQDRVTYNMRVLIAIKQTTQRQLAKAVGISAPTLSQKFSGRTRWNMDDIEKAAEFFNIEPATLVVGPQGLEPWTQRTWYVKDDFILAR